MNKFNNNIFEIPKLEKNSELSYRYLKTDNCRVEIIYSNEATTAWTEEDAIEVAFLLKGTAVVEEKGFVKTVLSAGEGIKIDAKAQHRVVSTSSDAIWLVVYAD